MQASDWPACNTRHVDNLKEHLQMVSRYWDSVASRYLELFRNELNLDFHLDDLLDNILTSPDAFIHAGFNHMKNATGVNTQWVKYKMQLFISPQRFAEGRFPRIKGHLGWRSHSGARIG
jgi:hypothetical protein